MPLGVMSTELLYSPGRNGIRVVSTKGTFEVWEDQLPNNVANKDVATIEAWINDWLAARTQPEFFAAVHIFSKDPLVLQLYTGAEPPPPNWWVEV